jgi:hypothetical protein
MRKWHLVFAASAVALVPTAASAQRSERVNRSILVVSEECPISSTAYVRQVRDAQTREAFFGPILGPLIASTVGDAVGAGISALGNALDRASQERGFVADGTTGFYIQTVQIDEQQAASLAQRDLCLSLYLPSTEGALTDIISHPDYISFVGSQARVSETGTASSEDDILAGAGQAGRTPRIRPRMSPTEVRQILEPLTEAGATRLPAVYVEALLLPRREGMVIQPIFAWYRQRMPGAPRGATPIEVHVNFATPANVAANPLEIGTIFAVSRMQLPDMAPGGLILGPEELRSTRSLIIPSRANSVGTDADLARYQGVSAAVATRRVEMQAAERARDAARRKAEATVNADTREALTVAEESLTRARAALSSAEAALSQLMQGPIHVGPVNARMRFVAVRERNAILQGVARILNARSQQADELVTQSLNTELTQPEWTAQRTAYLEAMQRVSAKERELEAGRPANDTATIVRLSDELTIARAKANEAAVAARMPLPFPALTLTPENR